METTYTLRQSSFIPIDHNKSVVDFTVDNVVLQLIIVDERSGMFSGSLFNPAYCEFKLLGTHSTRESVVAEAKTLIENKGFSELARKPR